MLLMRSSNCDPRIQSRFGTSPLVDRLTAWKPPVFLATFTMSLMLYRSLYPGAEPRHRNGSESWYKLIPYTQYSLHSSMSLTKCCHFMLPLRFVTRIGQKIHLRLHEAFGSMIK